MKRYAWVGKLKPNEVDKYVALHANPWPVVLQSNQECHLHNYSIYLKQMPGGDYYVFSYLEYTGNDFAADMKRLAANPDIQRWWDECKPCFEKLEGVAPGEVWAPMEMIFYQP